MGHYDSCYEHEESIRRAAIKDAYDTLVSDFAVFMRTFNMTQHAVKIPQRFRYNLEDFDNWLKVNEK